MQTSAIDVLKRHQARVGEFSLLGPRATSKHTLFFFLCRQFLCGLQLPLRLPHLRCSRAIDRRNCAASPASEQTNHTTRQVTAGRATGRVTGTKKRRGTKLRLERLPRTRPPPPPPLARRICHHRRARRRAVQVWDAGWPTCDHRPLRGIIFVGSQGRMCLLMMLRAYRQRGQGWRRRSVKQPRRTRESGLTESRGAHFARTPARSVVGYDYARRFRTARTLDDLDLQEVSAASRDRAVGHQPIS